jgi:GAF domain-containing protein
VQPTFDAIARSAALLCRADLSGVHRFDGELIHFAAQYGRTAEEIEAVRQAFPQRPSRASATARCILSAAVVQVADHHDDLDIVDSLRMFRTVLAVPMLREGRPVGSISVARRVVKPFTGDQVDLLKTFADQAVIAIENVRLFTELQEKNRALTDAHATVTESLEQQTATSEILRVISSSPTDVQPVFDTIVRNAVLLSGASWGVVTRVEAGLITFVAHHNLDANVLARMYRTWPRAVNDRGPTAGVVARGELFRVADLEAADYGLLPEVAAEFRARGIRSMLIVPMVRAGHVVGTINLTHQAIGAFSDADVALITTFADQAVIAIENVRLFKELEARNQQLTEALDQQTATSEILRVIASSPTDVEPVFERIVRSAAGVCDATDATLAVAESHEYRISAHYGPIPLRPVGSKFPIGIGTVMGRTILEGRVFHVEDLSTAEDFPQGQRLAIELGQRATLCVPLLREGVSIGTIMLRRTEAQLFTERQVTLLKTFADQAVIAIENVRLFKELQQKNEALTAAHAEVTETLEQQTATADVLKVISRSTFDLQPVLNTLIESATRLCGADKGFIFRRDGDVYRGVADSGTTPEHREYIRRTPVQVDRSTVVGRVALERRTIHFPDILLDPEYQWAEAQRIARFRTVLGVPMLRGGEPIGAFFIWREEVRPFTDKQIELVTTFADQAVIAVENTRLLGELRARTDDLTRSVEQLTALGEVGRAVSSTLDLETVLRTIVSRAVQLSGLDGGVVFEYDESAEEFVQRAMTDTGGPLAEARRTTRIRKGEGVLGRTAVTLEPVQVDDITSPGAYEGRLREVLIDSGVRAILAVPMVREGHLIGCLGVTRNSPGEFPAETIELLRTFATQSALAIQNARLFREIEHKSRELEAASRHKSEFLANMSHELRTPLNAIIGFSEVLSERMFGELNEKQEEYLKDIHVSGQHLLSLINDILDLSKIEAGRMELELTDFNLPTTLDNALTLVRERAARHGIALTMSVDERVEQVRADERKIRQVVLNLLSNAIKFTPEGGRIEVRAVPVYGSVEVSVTDTGVGIAPEDQEAIFEEFRQVGTADKKVEGTGLGLALSRKLIELHGGRIWVQSQVGAGSTFTFTIPIRTGA